MNRKTAQQEMIGFVLIVVIVIIGLMIFLLFSLKSPRETDSIEVENMLNSILRMTTECAVIFEPDYDSYEDLFKSCYENKFCKNLNENACYYLNQSMGKIITELVKSESTISAIQLDFFTKEEENLLHIMNGNCSESRIISSQRSVRSSSVNLIIRLKICKEDS